MEKLHVSTHAREEMLNVTELLREAVQTQGWNDGVLTVFCPHTTCGLTVNEGFDPDVPRDMTDFFCSLVPQSLHFRHIEGNSDAHIKATMLGSSVQLIVEEGKIALGTWQSIWLFDGDGPRTRQIWLKWQGKSR